jgi:hypothetical protein
MMRALFIKELRGLRPFALCIVGIMVVSLVYLVATEAPDEQRLVPAAWLTENQAGVFFLLLLFSLMLGAGLLINEREQGTLAFLDGLPLSRTRLFVAKVTAALAMLSLIPILGMGTELLLAALSRTSLAPSLHWTFVGVQCALQMLASAYLLAFALVLSFSRGWFALLAGTVFWGFLWLRQREIPWVANLDPYALLGPGLIDERVLVSWPQIGALTAATCVLLALAWMGFLSLGDRVQLASERLGRWRFLRVFGTGLKLLAPVVWIAAIVRLMGNIERDEAKEPAMMPLGEYAFSRRETQHYEFLFRSAQWDQAKELLDAADEVHEEVAEFLGGTPPPVRIVVDLASPILPHAAGQTNWTKIRMPIEAGSDLAERRRTLGHETAHVFIEQLGEGRLTSRFNNIRFLHEGLATHIEHELYAGPRLRAQQRRAVAGAWSRGRIPLGLLSDDRELTRTRDPLLVYPLGEVFARALIAAHGPEAPARLLRAFARDDAPPGLKDAALWRDTMQAAGLNIERVVAGYETTCAEMTAQEEKFVKRLPRISATVAVEGAKIVLRPTFTGVAPGEMVCAVEPSEPVGPPISLLSRQEDGSFTLERSRHTKATLRFLLGWRTPTTAHPIFEPWAESPVN